MSRHTRLTRQEKEKILLHFARKHLGKPYKYGARPWQAPRVFDCSSFVQYLYRRVGIEFPRVSIEQARHGMKVGSLRRLKIGDLVFLRGRVGRYTTDFPDGVGHVVMYIGLGRAIHAAGQRGTIGGKVIEQPLRTVVKGWGPVTIIRRYF